MTQVREPLAFKEKKSLQQRKAEADQIRTKVGFSFKWFTSCFAKMS